MTNSIGERGGAPDITNYGVQIGESAPDVVESKKLGELRPKGEGQPSLPGVGVFEAKKLENAHVGKTQEQRLVTQAYESLKWKTETRLNIFERFLQKFEALKEKFGIGRPDLTNTEYRKELLAVMGDIYKFCVLKQGRNSDNSERQFIYQAKLLFNPTTCKMGGEIRYGVHEGEVRFEQQLAGELRRVTEEWQKGEGRPRETGGHLQPVPEGGRDQEGGGFEIIPIDKLLKEQVEGEGSITTPDFTDDNLLDEDRSKRRTSIEVFDGKWTVLGPEGESIADPEDNEGEWITGGIDPVVDDPESVSEAPLDEESEVDEVVAQLIDESQFFFEADKTPGNDPKT